MSTPEPEIPVAVASLPKDERGSRGELYINDDDHSPGLDPLYTVRQVRVSTFFGGPVAAVWLLALNFKHLGQSRLILKTLLIGALATAMYFTVAFLLPDSVPGLPVVIVGMLIAGKITEYLQGAKLARHNELGGALASNWKVAGVSLAGGVGTAVVLAVIFVGINFDMLMAEPVSFAGGSEVYYFEGASKAEAQLVGDALEELDYFLEQPASVAVLPGSALVVRFFVMDEAIGDPEVELFYQTLDLLLEELLGRDIQAQLSTEIGSTPISLKQLPSY